MGAFIPFDRPLRHPYDPYALYLQSPDASLAVRLLFSPAAFPVGSSTCYIFFVVHLGIVYRFEISLALLSR